MTLSDFRLGGFFRTGAGVWRCTDIGLRVITAIQIDDHDTSWFAGPPFAVDELVFDENDQPGCQLLSASEESEFRKRIEKITCSKCGSREVICAMLGDNVSVGCKSCGYVEQRPLTPELKAELERVFPALKS